MIILSGLKPSFNVLRHQAVELIDQKLANRAKACKFHHLEKPVFVKVKQLQVGVFNNATRVISLLG